jgi:hypothetical protein
MGLEHDPTFNSNGNHALANWPWPLRPHCHRVADPFPCRVILVIAAKLSRVCKLKYRQVQMHGCFELSILSSSLNCQGQIFSQGPPPRPLPFEYRRSGQRQSAPHPLAETRDCFCMAGRTIRSHVLVPAVRLRYSRGQDLEELVGGEEHSSIISLPAEC